MKNLFGKFASFACILGVAVAFTACHRGDSTDPAASEIHEDEVIELKTTNTLVVKLNGPDLSGAKVTYNGKSGVQSGTAQFTWSNADKTGKIQVGGSLISQTVDVNFGERTTLVVEIDAVKASTNPVAQSAVDAGADVENDDTNKNNSGASVKLNLNGSVANTNGNSRPYMVTVYTPATGDPKEVKKGQPYPQVPYAVDCQPSGTTFTYPGIHMDLTVEGAGEIGDAGIEFKHSEDGTPANNKTVVNNTVSGDLPHFSAWNVVVLLNCIDIVDGEEQIAAGTLKEGDNTISYNEFFGYKSDVKGILAKCLPGLFGASETTVQKTSVINAPSEGSYKIVQYYENCTFQAGSKVFVVKVWGDVEASVTYTGTQKPDSDVPTVPTHVGGSND